MSQKLLPPIPPTIPQGFHAFLLADVWIRDPGMGSMLEVVLHDGQRLWARASPEVLRSSGTLRGRQRVTLHFRTDASARLKEPLHLYRVRSIQSQLDPVTETYWTAAGLRLSGGLMVFPEKARTTPFAVTFESDQVGEACPGLYQSVRACGVVRAGTLVATSVEPIAALKISARWEPWRGWI